MLFNETVSTASNESILQMLANATKTYYGCFGHTKAEMNEQRIAICKDELSKRNIAIPSEDELLKRGIYNGEGSF